MALPNFLIVGAQKCGTTTLHDILSDHPEANMSKVKEINYFTSNSKITKGLGYYSNYFKDPLASQKVTGESSPGYMCYPGAAKLIKQELGEIKIVMILRDPVRRAYSQYWDNRRHLSEQYSELEIIDKYLTDEYNVNTKGYFSRGVYIKYINEYLKYFSASNIHIIILEELIRNPKVDLKNLFQFLDIDSELTLLKLNKSSNQAYIYDNPFYKYVFANPGLTPLIPLHIRRFFFFGKKIQYNYSVPNFELLKKVYEFYKPWNEELESFIGRKLNVWD